MTSSLEVAARVSAFTSARLPALGAARVVLALSGGADSTALVALLCDAGIVDERRAVIGHFDHALRGDDASARERAAVQGLAARYALPVVTDRWATPSAGEAPARAARYAFLARLAGQCDAAAVVTGHTCDDQAETVLMHAMRGAGLHGLAGMAADARLPVAGADLRLWRPLLAVARDETRAYCIDRRLAFVDDASNEDRAFARNRVRLDLLPALARARRDIRSDLLRLAEGARSASRALDAVARAALPAREAGDQEIALSRQRLRALPAEVLPHAFRLAITGLLGDAREFERRHYAMLARSVEARTGATIMLPRRLVATVDAAEIMLSLGPPRATPIADGFQAVLPFDGVVGDWQIEVRPSRSDEDWIALPRAAVVRGRRPGDRLQPRGMAGHRKLQDYYVDRKVPRRYRDAAPVIAAGGDVLWTPFGACETTDSEAYRLDAMHVRSDHRAH